MAGRFYSAFLFDFAAIDLTDGEVQADLIMTGHTCLANDPAVVSGFTTPKVCDATGYTPLTVYFVKEREPDEADPNAVASGNNPNIRVVLKSMQSDLVTPVNTLVWPDVAADATATIVGVRFSTKSTHPTHPNLPIAYVDSANGPHTANGRDIEISVSSTGVMKLANKAVS